MKRWPEESPIYQDIDWKELEPSSIELLKLEKDSHFSSEEIQNKILVADSLDPEDVLRFMAHFNCEQIIQKRSSCFVHDIQKLQSLKNSSDLYFASGGSVFLQKIENSTEIPFKKSEDKNALMTSITEFTEKFCSGTVQMSVRAIAEELFMNATLDAPREAVKKNIKIDTLPPNLMRIYKGPDRLLISCEDPYGALPLEKTIQRMDQVYTVGAGTAMNLKAGEGAGIGCVIMFEHSEAMIFGVQPMKKTLVSCLIPLGMSLKQREQLKKSIYLIKGT